MMNRKNLYTCLIGLLVCCQTALAQEGGEMIRGKLISETGEELISATVLEMDATGRIITDAVTDLNGEFSMKIKNPKNKLRFSYLGFITKDMPIGTNRNFSVTLKEQNVLSEVVVSARKTVSSGGMDIPSNEVPFAMQRISAKTFEGLSVASLDDALQGHIAGLDVVGAGGQVGKGAQMRIRGIASLNPNINPLIVINGIPRSDLSETSASDLSEASEQQFADLLMLNPDDIEDVSVLKDAGATAIYGTRGAGGVLLITTKKGVQGPTRVSYTYKYTGSTQPKGLKMLNGDDYTMLMKQAYFNVSQNSSASNIPEFTYDPTFSEYRHYNNNTDWRDAVLQYGPTHDHYLAISGGGERAKFRVTGGYMTKDGTVIGNKWNRLTSRTNLDYSVSERILFTSEFAFTYSDNKQNWKDSRNDNNKREILGIAYMKMPNMSIYNKDENGNNLATYYNMRRDSKLASGEQGSLRNPVALARLALNNTKSYDIHPTLRLRYDIFDPTEQTLQYEGWVSFSLNNSNTHKFLPKEVSAETWGNEDVNRLDETDSKSFSTQSENKIKYIPNLGPDHRLMAYLSVYTESGNSNGQNIVSSGYPNQNISDPTAEGYVRDLTSSIGQWRSLAFSGQIHYSYLSKYILFATFRREGSTKFGKDNKYGDFPGVSLRWNISEEDFMKPLFQGLLTMLSVRPSWGVTGYAPGAEYMHFSRYSPWSSYGGVSTIRPENIRLSNLKWEKTTEYNLGTDLELWEGKYTMDANVYYRKTTDLLFQNAPIPSSTGYDAL
ncbi:MAG: SusC/RagA family TonB-linked outer membrane protein, partial [Prevotella sp.]|nr:SusC/RagA family TonB-linked outer membrane protein [Prevotella sp.]